MSAARHAITVAADASGKILVKAKGGPAQVVAYGAAAALVFVGVGIGYGAYLGGVALKEKLLPGR